MPVDLGPVNGFTTRFHLYTVPGQIYYRRSRRAVLQGVDGIVFVADSQPDRERDNVESLEDMHVLLGQIGLGAAQVTKLPRVIQYNKRDVVGAMPVERMRALLNPGGLPDFEATAVEGKGVSETMRAIAKGVLSRLTGLTQPNAAPAPAPGATVARPTPPAAAPAPPPRTTPPAPPRAVPPAPPRAHVPPPAPEPVPAAAAVVATPTAVPAPPAPAPIAPAPPVVGPIVPVMPVGPVRPPVRPRTPITRRGLLRRTQPTRP